MTTRTAILIIRLSAIGDVVMASPLIGALRARYPDAHIAWLAQPEVADLLTANPLLDEVIVWPRGEWRRLWRARRFVALWRALREFRRQLRERHFDLALELHGLLKSALPAWLSGARERIGLGAREGSGLFMTRVLPRDAGDTARISSEYLYLAQVLGLPSENFAMDIALTAEDEAYAARVRREHGLEGGYAVICPFTTRPQKHWFDARWVELVRDLHARHGLRTLLLGGPGDRERAAILAGQCGEALLNLAGETRLREAAALIKQARLLVGVDTGLTHMGVALDAPTIALFGATRPYLDTGRDDAVVLYHRLPCSPCRRRPTCAGAYTCMHDIDVAEVRASAARLLDKRSPP